MSGDHWRNQPRQPKGTPIGGEFDNMAGGGAATSLGSFDDAAKDGIDQATWEELFALDAQVREAHGAADGYTDEQVRRACVADMASRIADPGRFTPAMLDELTDNNAHAIREAVEQAQAGPGASWSARDLGPQQRLRAPASTWNVAGGRQRTWWEAHRALISQAGAAGGVPRMEEGRRYRGVGSKNVAYRGANLEVTMPSVASARRFARELRQAGADPATFDVPVTVTHSTGGQVDGWVRVVRTSDGRWAAAARAGDDLPEGIRDRVSESVAALLEARQPSLGLSRYQDILAHARERKAAEGVDLREIASSPGVTGLGYDPNSGTMFVQHPAYTRKSDGVTVPARVYGYTGIGQPDFERLLAAPARGSGIGREIDTVRSKDARVEVGHCERCGRWYNATAAHRCPVAVTA